MGCPSKGPFTACAINQTATDEFPALPVGRRRAAALARRWFSPLRLAPIAKPLKVVQLQRVRLNGKCGQSTFHWCSQFAIWVVIAEDPTSVQFAFGTRIELNCSSMRVEVQKERRSDGELECRTSSSRYTSFVIKGADTPADAPSRSTRRHRF